MTEWFPLVASFVAPIVSAILAYGVANGVTKSKLEAHEKEIALLRTRFHELANSLQRLIGRIEGKK